MGVCVPRRTISTKQQAAESDGDLRVISLCQKASAQRSPEDIRYICSYLAGLSYFFSLWPAALQWELCRLVGVHILARREVALTRGRPPDRMYFVLKGKVRGNSPPPRPAG